MAIIKLERSKCIGCGSCTAMCPKFFKMEDDGRSSIVGVKISEMQELEINKIDCTEAAVDVCPVQCINIEK
jgi:ferredoxin